MQEVLPQTHIRRVSRCRSSTLFRSETQSRSQSLNFCLPRAHAACISAFSRARSVNRGLYLLLNKVVGTVFVSSFFLSPPGWGLATQGNTISHRYLSRRDKARQGVQFPAVNRNTALVITLPYSGEEGIQGTSWVRSWSRRL